MMSFPLLLAAALLPLAAPLLPLAAALLPLAAPPSEVPAPGDPREVLGVAHVAGKYAPGKSEQDFLNQGADEILAMGSRTIKVWFSNPKTSYPYHSTWPDAFGSLVEMAQHPYYKSLFEKPFRHYILLVYSLGRPEHYWTNGISEAEKADEQQQFRALAEYLLRTYKNTNKTFVLQHWEGDWAIRGNYDANQPPTPKANEGMIGWLNARQAGVDQARNAITDSTAHVYHAAEVNLVLSSLNENKPNVVNNVLPHTTLDLVSYSAWDTVPKGGDFRRALDYIAAQMPDRPPFGAKNVYIGEYGWPENDAPKETVQAAIRNVVETARDWGCPYAIYWQLYCNEARRTPVAANDDVRGFWLIKPDGSKSWAWTYLQGQIFSSKP